MADKYGGAESIEASIRVIEKNVTQSRNAKDTESLKRWHERLLELERARAAQVKLTKEQMEAELEKLGQEYSKVKNSNSEVDKLHKRIVEQRIAILEEQRKHSLEEGRKEGKEEEKWWEEATRRSKERKKIEEDKRTARKAMGVLEEERKKVEEIIGPVQKRINVEEEEALRIAKRAEKLRIALQGQAYPKFISQEEAIDRVLREEIEKQERAQEEIIKIREKTRKEELKAQEEEIKEGKVIEKMAIDTKDHQKAADMRSAPIRGSSLTAAGKIPLYMAKDKLTRTRENWREGLADLKAGRTLFMQKYLGETPEMREEASKAWESRKHRKYLNKGEWEEREKRKQRKEELEKERGKAGVGSEEEARINNELKEIEKSEKEEKKTVKDRRKQKLIQVAGLVRPSADLLIILGFMFYIIDRYYFHFNVGHPLFVGFNIFLLLYCWFLVYEMSFDKKVIGVLVLTAFLEAGALMALGGIIVKYIPASSYLGDIRIDWVRIIQYATHKKYWFYWTYLGAFGNPFVPTSKQGSNLGRIVKVLFILFWFNVLIFGNIFQAGIAIGDLFKEPAAELREAIPGPEAGFKAVAGERWKRINECIGMLGWNLRSAEASEGPCQYLFAPYGTGCPPGKGTEGKRDDSRKDPVTGQPIVCEWKDGKWILVEEKKKKYLAGLILDNEDYLKYSIKNIKQRTVKNIVGATLTVDSPKDEIGIKVSCMVNKKDIENGAEIVYEEPNAEGRYSNEIATVTDDIKKLLKAGLNINCIIPDNTLLADSETNEVTFKVEIKNVDYTAKFTGMYMGAEELFNLEDKYGGRQGIDEKCYGKEGSAYDDCYKKEIFNFQREMYSKEKGSTKRYDDLYPRREVKSWGLNKVVKWFIEPSLNDPIQGIDEGQHIAWSIAIEELNEDQKNEIAAEIGTAAIKLYKGIKPTITCMFKDTPEDTPEIEDVTSTYPLKDERKEDLDFEALKDGTIASCDTVISSLTDFISDPTELSEITTELEIKDITYTIKKSLQNVKGFKRPKAVASASPTTTKVGETVTFSGKDSTDEDGVLVSYEWDFDDGSRSDEQNPTHSFAEARTYTVTLKVTDNDELDSTATITVKVEAVKNEEAVSASS